MEGPICKPLSEKKARKTSHPRLDRVPRQERGASPSVVKGHDQVETLSSMPTGAPVGHEEA